VIPQKIVERLKKVYKDVDDVDLFIGGISESPLPGAILGQTFQCLVGDQFKRLQQGDRYYYDSEDNPGKFTEAQLVEIRHANLARITCDNGDDIHHMQPLAFKKPSKLNPLIPCNAITIPIVDLHPWQEIKSQHPKKTSQKNLSNADLVSSPQASPFKYKAVKADPRRSQSVAPPLLQKHLSRLRSSPFQSHRHRLSKFGK